MSSHREVSKKTMALRANALARHCSIRSVDALDTILFRGETTAIGEFRCAVDHPSFRDSGPTEQAIVVFPRTSVWIRHEGSRSFVADPTVVTIYNRAQCYERHAISMEGDRCDWFAVSDALARDIVSPFDPAAGEHESRAFRFEAARSTADLYISQRRLARRAALRATDALEMEEEIIAVVSQVMALAYHHAPDALARRDCAARRRRDIVEYAKAELLRTMSDNRSVSDIARSVGTSVFHLCRVFRAQTGRTMHAYRTELRLRAALELVADGPAATLSAVAFQLGFASHSHLARVFRNQWGTAPRAVRELLCGGTQ